MRKLSSVSAVLFLLLPLQTVAQQTKATASIVNATETFLSTLDADQQKHVLYAFDDNEQRQRWSNFPTGVVPRGGISFKQMTASQREAAMTLLAIVLSPMGLEKVNEIRQADDDFKANGSKRGPGGRGPGGRGPGGPPPGGQNGSPPGARTGSGGSGGRGPMSSEDLFGSSLYYISVVGTPSITSPWMLQFGGHHLALNITISGNKGVLTPTLTGAQPASFQKDGQTIRPVGRESDKALALLQSLDDKQRKQAVLHYEVADLVLGPGQDGKKIVPEGLKVSAMKEKQKAMVVDLIAEWVGILNDGSAAATMSEIKKDLNETWFAWSGDVTGEPGTNISAYYRIQGPHLVIEYAPQHDEPTNHVHTMYRDPTNDYGGVLIKQ